MKMKFHFSLYGFLKNQKFYEPFILLFFLQKGLNLFEIGLVFGFRELIANLMEIPSGAVADLWGKRKAMIISFLSYIISFLIFTYTAKILWLAVGFIFFGIGEAFRTGTHKAIIYEYLRYNGQEKQLKEFYGYTRSWSKIGSAVSIIFSLLIVFLSNSYQYIFLFAAIPYLIGIINFFFYPDYIDNQKPETRGIKDVFFHIWETFKQLFQKKEFLVLFFTGWSYNGIYKILKDYLQLIVKTAILTFPLLITLSKTKRESLFIGIFYFIFYLISAWGSKKSHQFSQKGLSLTNLLLITSIIILLLGIGYQLKLYYLSIFFFILYTFFQNIFRPLFLSEAVEMFPQKEGMATFLSIENQGQTLIKIIMAPLLGFLAQISLAYSFYFASLIIFSLFIILNKTLPQLKGAKK